MENKRIKRVENKRMKKQKYKIAWSLYGKSKIHMSINSWGLIKAESLCNFANKNFINALHWIIKDERRKNN